MKKVICKKTYDTETATLIKAYSFSQLGDPAGYEEDLYQTPEGLYFLHVGGGETSIYPAEDIVRITYGRNTIYEAPQVQRLDRGMHMKGM